MNKIIKLLKRTAMFTALSAICLHASAQQKESLHQTAVTQFIQANGTTYAYRSFGLKTGIPILFLQHFMGTMDNWDPAITDALASSHRIILFDNKGVGSSSGQTPESVQDMAHSAIDFIEALHLQKVDLLGFSLGGCVAQEILLMNPELVRNAVLAGTGPRGGEYHDIGLLIKNHPVTNPGDLLLYLMYDRTAGSQEAGNAFLARITTRSKNRDTDAGSQTFVAQVKALNDYFADKNDFSALDKITNPILVINGVHDIIIPAVNSLTIENHVRHAKLVIYPDAGHGALFQYNQDFVTQINSFLAKGQ